MSSTAKLSAKDRIYTLLDDNSFVEIGALVTKRNTDFNMQQMSAPGDGIVTGYGVINDNLVYVYSQDASALNGTIGEMHAKKIINLYRLAMKTGAPVIGLIDCAGIRLQEASDALASFGRLYKAEAMASGVVPQITAVFGECGGGLAVLAEMSDFVMMSKDAKLFVTAPNAIAGNNEGKLDTASASYMAASGAVDYVGEDEVAVLNRIRDLVDIRGGPVRKLQHVPEGRHIQIYHEAVDRHLAKVGTRISDAALFHLFLYHFIFMIGQFQEKLFRSCKTHFLILSTFKQRSQSKDKNYHLILWDRRLMLILSTSLL